VLVPAAKSGRAIACPLPCAEAQRAARLFIERDAFGPMSNGAADRALKRACMASGVARFSLYQIRHSFAHALREAGADLADVGVLLGHAPGSAVTTRYAPTVAVKLAQAVARLAVADGSDYPDPAGSHGL